MNIDKFDLEKLVYMYRERFSKVCVVPLSEMSSMQFMREVFSVDESIINKCAAAFGRARRENVAYSSLAMKMTFIREKFLSFFGLKSIGTCDFEITKLFSYTLDKGGGLTEQIGVYKNSRKLLMRLIMKIRTIISWRYLMQQVVGRVSRGRYKLPCGLIPDEIIEKNRLFYEKLLVDSKAIKQELKSYQ